MFLAGISSGGDASTILGRDVSKSGAFTQDFGREIAKLGAEAPSLVGVHAIDASDVAKEGEVLAMLASAHARVGAEDPRSRRCTQTSSACM